MRTEFRMTSRELAEEAIARLASLGFLRELAHGDDRRLIVHHEDHLAEEVRRIVEIVDPASAEIRQ